MRLFVALLPPPSVLDEVADALDGCRASWGDLRWLPREQWHVTLSFLGEVDDSVVPALEERLERAAARYAPMTLVFSGAGGFPSVARARVFWVGLSGPSSSRGRERVVRLPDLSRLAASLTAGARRAGAVEIDHKRFRPHLTLARSRQEADLRPLVEAMSSFVGAVWEAGAVHLMRSHAGPPVRYESLVSWPLSAVRSVG